MKRVFIVLLLALFGLGCATTRPEMVAGLTLDEQLEAYIDDYLGQVLGLCQEMSEKAHAGKSPVDCAYNDKLNRMYLNFPNGDYVEKHRRDILLLAHHWCAASQSKTGQPSVWVGYLREEKQSQAIRCPRR